MSDICDVKMTGRLTDAMELRYTSSGYPIASFTLAFNKARKNAAGEWEEKGHFVDCKIFGKRAEVLAEMLAKGTFVMVSGELEQERWERDGQKRSKISIIVRDLKFDPKANGIGGHSGGEPGGVEQQGGVYDSDIPF